jgi:hypothetical protein
LSVADSSAAHLKDSTNAGTLVPESPAAHPKLRDDLAPTDASKATIASAIVGFSVSLVAVIVVLFQIISWFSSWTTVLRHLLGYP